MGCQQGQGRKDVFLLQVSVLLTTKTLSIRRENNLFPVYQLHTRYGTGVQVPIRSALLTLSKALPPTDTEMSRSTISVVLLIPLAHKSDCS